MNLLFTAGALIRFGLFPSYSLANFTDWDTVSKIVICVFKCLSSVLTFKEYYQFILILLFHSFFIYLWSTWCPLCWFVLKLCETCRENVYESGGARVMAASAYCLKCRGDLVRTATTMCKCSLFIHSLSVWLWSAYKKTPTTHSPTPHTRTHTKIKKKLYLTLPPPPPFPFSV